MLAGSYNPILAYGSLFSRAFGDLYNLGETIRQITPYIFTGLAVAFAFRSGLFNIGAEGQFIMGAVAAAAAGILLELPWYLHVPLALVAGALTGGLWGAIVGWLKAARGVHEVITTIMLNWIALHLANYIVRSALLEKGMARSRYLHESAWLSTPDLTGLFDNARIHYGILVALVLAALFRFLLWKTRLGFEFRAVGFNPDASEYAGINVKSAFVKAMFISGLFAGAGGACEVMGVNAVASIAFRADQVVSGVALNLLASGATIYVCKILLDGAAQTPTLKNVFAKWAVPLLSDIPYLGQALFIAYPTSYIAFLLVAVVWFVLYRTPAGLRLRSVGEHPEAADSLGIRVHRVRYAAVMISGALAAMGGATITLTTTSNFSHSTISGQGFIALAALIFGKWRPAAGMFAALFFGIASALKSVFQVHGITDSIPVEFIYMFPYILTVLVLAGFVGRAVAPAAAGKPYRKGER
nr:hypothetical protein [Thermobacillus sp. ZCTH02-B1]